MITHKQLEIALYAINFNNQKLKDIAAIKKLVINPDGVVQLDITIKKELPPLEVKKLKTEITKLVKLDYAFNGLKLDVLSEEKKEFCQKQFKYLLVLSGKGGVGKSTTAYYIAQGLQQQGYKIGLIDADIFGASIPQLAGLNGQKLQGKNELIIPQLTQSGIQVVSTNFMVDEGEALIWRAPLIQNVLDYFFKKTLWDNDLDLIVIDMPPGTGDILIDVMNYTKDNLNAVIVTTPDNSAAKIALKSGSAITKVGGNIIGIIENMAYFDTGNSKEYIFGQGGGEEIARLLSTKLLAQIPLYKKYSPKFYQEILNDIIRIVKL